MKVKKFFASNNYEALNMVKNEMGSDAVIIYQKKVKPKGFFGLFKKPIIEVVAAKEDRMIHRLEKPADRQDDLPTIEILQKKVEESKRKSLSSTKIDAEVNEIKNMLNTVLEKINQQQLPDIIKSIDNEAVLNLYNTLKKQGLEEALIEEIISRYIAFQNTKPTLVQDDDWLKLEIKKIIHKYIVLHNRAYDAKMLFFIGPTGVGKTTTIAKLAAQYTLNEGKSVGLISADTYRIAAVEQLKTYSDILNIPLEVIYHSSEIHPAANRLSGKDIIMVDTAGRSHKDKKQMGELKDLLDEIKEKEIYLVLSCTSKHSDINEIIKTYEFIDNYNIIFTKIDEASSFGTILNTAKKTKQPLTYITTGQSVPDDIETVDIDKIVNLLMKEALQ